MTINLYNSRTRKIEEFKSLEEGKVKMYSCGPTVYNSAHIGNLRAFIFADLMKKMLMTNGYEVKHIMNITDFGHLTSDGDDGDDKMSVGLKRENLPRNLSGMKMLADKYTKTFLEDIAKLNILPAEVYPRASENIEEYINIIQGLMNKEFTYIVSDGIYFDTALDNNYGYMSNLDKSDVGQSRLTEISEKKNKADFALWKFGGEFGFESPFGIGFPGWHIECSGMALKFLGESMDIHTGGIDHIDVHHTNEIAQSENFTGKTYATFFCHNAFLNIDNQTMSKSKNNFLTLSTIIENGFESLDFRYLNLTCHYRQNLNFSNESMLGAKNSLKNLRKQIENLNIKKNERQDTKNIEINQKYLDEFIGNINEDLNTAKALATLWNMLSDKSLSDNEKYCTAIKFDEFFSLDLNKYEINNSKEKEYTFEIKELMIRREDYRKDKNWIKADEIRDRLKELGVNVEDKAL